MKNLVLIFSVIFLVTSCTTIGEQYTEIKVKPKQHKEYSSYSGGFSFGFPYFFWSSYSYYGLYDYYYGYYRGYSLPSYQKYRSNKTVITKKQLKKRTSSRATAGNVQGNVGKTRSTVTKSDSSTKSKGTVKKKE